MSQLSGTPQFFICVQNHGCDDLIVGKVYRSCPDEAAGVEKLVRIIDESGEDYLYPTQYFVSIVLPQAAERALFTTASVSAD